MEGNREPSKRAGSAPSLLCRNQIRKPSETEKLGKAHSVSLLTKSTAEPPEPPYSAPCFPKCQGRKLRECRGQPWTPRPAWADATHSSTIC